MGSGVLDDDEAMDIALEGYLYLYPLVLMELSRRQLTYGPADTKIGKNPMGMFSHVRAYPTAEFRSVVRPNFDTLYSTAWVDVTDEPTIISLPASKDRYYLLPCYDMWTDSFASPGTRTTGGDAVTVALCSPTYSGPLPQGARRIDCPTPIVWIIGRTQTNGPADYEAVHAFQDDMVLRPLSCFGGPAPDPVVNLDETIDRKTPPLEQVNAMSGAAFFSLAAELLAIHPPHHSDWNIVARLARLGVAPGAPVDDTTLSATAASAIADAPGRARRHVLSSIATLAPLHNGWLTFGATIGVYGNDYAKRAFVAMVGLGANPPEDSIYPVLQKDADGAPLDGANTYRLHFSKDGLPPVDAFWSITMYDAAGFPIPNPLNRYALGDRDPLSYNPDGSLELIIAPTQPETAQSNWLPSAPGGIGVTMRLYAPTKAALSGAWVPPVAERIN